MINSFFKNISFLGVGLSAGTALIFLFIKNWIWSVGILTGSLWFFLNSFFLYQLLEIGLGAKSKHKERILIFSILKFPVLYLIGFFILKSRFFPIYSLLLGLTLYFIALGIVWMRFNLGPASHLAIPSEPFDPAQVQLRESTPAGLTGRDQTL